LFPTIKLLHTNWCNSFNIKPFTIYLLVRWDKRGNIYLDPSVTFPSIGFRCVASW
jgi:hypothetical protein